MQASAAPSTRAKANKGTPYSSPRALCAWPTRRPCRRRAQLCPAGECLAAFLDDVYLVTTLSRAREALDVRHDLPRDVGGSCRHNWGKTRATTALELRRILAWKSLGLVCRAGTQTRPSVGLSLLVRPSGIRSSSPPTPTRQVRLLHELPMLPDLQCT